MNYIQAILSDRKKRLIAIIIATALLVVIIGILAYLSAPKQATVTHEATPQATTKSWDAVEATLKEVESLIAAGEYDAATERLQKIDKDYPHQDKITQLQKRIDEAKAKQAEEEAKKNEAASPQPAVAQPVAPRPQPAPAVSFSTPINIIGDDSCRNDTLAAMKMLSQSAGVHYTTVTTYVATIECIASGSGMYSAEKRYVVGDATRNAGALWYAGTIAHDACHSRQYHTGLPSSGKESERQCLDVQVDALTQMGAPQSTIDYVNNIINSEYWDVPYEGRWW